MISIFPGTMPLFPQFSHGDTYESGQQLTFKSFTPKAKNSFDLNKDPEGLNTRNKSQDSGNCKLDQQVQQYSTVTQKKG